MHAFSLSPHPHTQTHVHTNSHMHTHTFTHACIHTDTHTHIQTHTTTHTHTQGEWLQIRVRFVAMEDEFLMSAVDDEGGVGGGAEGPSLGTEVLLYFVCFHLFLSHTHIHARSHTHSHTQTLAHSRSPSDIHTLSFCRAHSHAHTRVPGEGEHVGFRRQSLEYDAQARER